jgi:hypothetical protein
MLYDIPCHAAMLSLYGRCGVTGPAMDIGPHRSRPEGVHALCKKPGYDAGQNVSAARSGHTAVSA